jgi:hypothetical protein
MKYSLQDYVNLITPYLSDELVSQQVLKSIQQVAQLLPPLSPTLLECRLEADRSQVDLSVGLQPMKFPIAEQLIAHPFWQQLDDFCQDWTTANSLLAEAVEDIWLEFDLDGELDAVKVACWFFSLQGEIFQHKDAAALSKLLELVALLQKCPVDELRSNLIRRCVRELPECVGIGQIGAMLTRQGEPLRLNVNGLSATAIPAYLARVQAEAIDPELVKILDCFSHLTDRIVLCFDVEARIGARIGLECYLDKQPQKEPRWAEFLDLLVETNVCTLAKRDALLSWPGLIQQKDVRDGWPINLQQLEPLMDRSNISVFWRTINHIKLVYQPNRPLEAKAYLAFGHRWVDLHRSNTTSTPARLSTAN